MPVRRDPSHLPLTWVALSGFFEMRKSEQLLWDRLKRCRDLRAPMLYMERMENRLGEGRPDIDTLWRGRFVPVELKQVDAYPARSNTPVLGSRGLNQQQVNWHLSWRQHGGTSLILVGVRDAQSLYLVNGSQADDLNRLSRAELPLMSVVASPHVADIITYLTRQ
jgi:hypothetical protein